MIKRYGNELDIEEVADGDWVTYEDYQSLQAALSTVIDQWEWWERQEEKENMQKALSRIAELRKQFLDI